MKKNLLSLSFQTERRGLTSASMNTVPNEDGESENARKPIPINFGF